MGGTAPQLSIIAPPPPQLWGLDGVMCQMYQSAVLTEVCDQSFDGLLVEEVEVCLSDLLC